MSSIEGFAVQFSELSAFLMFSLGVHKREKKQGLAGRREGRPAPAGCLPQQLHLEEESGQAPLVCTASFSLFPHDDLCPLRIPKQPTVSIVNRVSQNESQSMTNILLSSCANGWRFLIGVLTSMAIIK